MALCPTRTLCHPVAMMDRRASMQPCTPAAYQLLHDGSIALAQAERVGMRIDVDYLDRTISSEAAWIRDRSNAMMQHDVWRWWRRRWGDKANLGSREQLAEVLFGKGGMGYKPHHYTDGTEYSGTADEGKSFGADEGNLERLDLDFAKDYIELQSHLQMKNTFLFNIRRHVEADGLLHPFFNLHTVRTFRSSGSEPNFQNIPIRDPVLGKTIRQAFIPRSPDHVLVELDYAQIEVRVSACYNHDQKLIYDVLHGDMHRDMAAECFMLAKDQVSKPARQTAKGGFVFAEFYGDWYKKVCKNLWDDILRQKLATKDGVPLYEHLARQGITRLGACDPQRDPVPGTFEHHIKKVEDRFWNERYRTYTQWKKDWYAAYKRQGYFNLYTGFLCQGVYSRNDVINYPVQGAAFHCLLWSLIRITKRLLKERWRSHVIGQIHDSIVADVHRSELPAFLEMAREIMTTLLMDHWHWLHECPVEVEAEACPLGGTWYDKKAVDFNNVVAL